MVLRAPDVRAWNGTIKENIISIEALHKWMNLEGACGSIEQQLKEVYTLLRRRDPDRADAMLKLAMAMIPGTNIFHDEDLGFVKTSVLFRKVVDRGMRTELFIKHYLDVLILILDAIESIQDKESAMRTQDDMVAQLAVSDGLGVAASLKTTLTARRLVINPIKEITGLGRDRALIGKMQKGHSYLILEDDGARAFSTFVSLLNEGYHGLCICRRFPAKVRKSYNIQKTPMLWLSQTDSEEDHIDPKELVVLMNVLKDFFTKVEEGVVMIEGLEYLIVQNGFDAVLRFLQQLNELVIINDIILIMPFNDIALPERELALLRSEMEIVDRAKVTGPRHLG